MKGQLGCAGLMGGDLVVGDESKGRGWRTATGWVRFIYAGQTPATLGGGHEPVEPTAFPAKAVSLASEGIAEEFKLSNIVRRDIDGLQKRDSRLSAFELKGGPWCSPPKQPDHAGGAYFQTARREASQGPGSVVSVRAANLERPGLSIYGRTLASRGGRDVELSRGCAMMRDDAA